MNARHLWCLEDPTYKNNTNLSDVTLIYTNGVVLFFFSLYDNDINISSNRVQTNQTNQEFEFTLLIRVREVYGYGWRSARHMGIGYLYDEVMETHFDIITCSRRCNKTTFHFIFILFYLNWWNFRRTRINIVKHVRTPTLIIEISVQNK